MEVWLNLPFRKSRYLFLNGRWVPWRGFIVLIVVVFEESDSAIHSDGAKMREGSGEYSFVERSPSGLQLVPCHDKVLWLYGVDDLFALGNGGR